MCLDPVEHGTAGILLLEVGGLSGADRKTLPVDDRAGRVGDRQFIALSLQHGLAVCHLRTGRVGLRQLGPHAVNTR